MEQIVQIKQYADTLRLTQLKNAPEEIIHQAQIDKPSYLEYTHGILKREVLQRQKTDYERRSQNRSYNNSGNYFGWNRITTLS